MKICFECRETKPILDYYKMKSAPDGLQRYCKPCADIKSAESRSKNKQKYRLINKGVYDRFIIEMKKYKTERGCFECGENHPAVLDLHHTDPSIKDLNPSNSTSRKMFYQEAEKCIVLCSNCHRKVHYKACV